MEYPRILLADDQREILEAAAHLLEAEFEIVGTAENGLRAVEEAVRLDPDVLVFDLSMPILSGLEAAFYLKGSGCRGRIIFLTVHEGRDFVEAALSIGALGYVIKSRLATDLVPAIQEVLLGHTYVSPSLNPAGTVSEEHFSRI